MPNLVPDPQKQVDWLSDDTTIAQNKLQLEKFISGKPQFVRVKFCLKFSAMKNPLFSFFQIENLR